MSHTFSRRDFLKISGTGLTAAALSAAYSPLLGASNSSKGPASSVTKTPTYCEICFWKCAGFGHVENGRLWKITGNPADPLCNGRLCPRGTGGVGVYYEPERLRTPLMRFEKGGRQEFREVSWDDAFSFIAEKMEGIKAKYGPECVALFTHGSGGKYFSDVLRAFGSGNVAAPSYAQCRGPREVGFDLTYGEVVGSPERTDIENADCMVLIGSHLGENMHNSQVQEFSHFVSAGKTLIVVDPRFSTAAGKAKYWLPIKPATDMALILSWMNVLISEDLYDREYVAQNTFGFEQLKAEVSQWTPEWAYPITSIAPEVIRATAREMGKSKPATLIHPGRHVTWYGDDTQRSRAIAILAALLGSWGRKGGYYFPAKAKVPAMPHKEFPKLAGRRDDIIGKQYPLADNVLASGLCEATLPLPARVCNLRGWIVYGTNLIHTLPKPEQTKEAIQHLDLMVAIDILPAEITGYADVVLPECSYLERYDDLRISPYKVPSIALRAPVMAPVGNSKPGWWIAKELARHLKLEDYIPYKDIEEMLEWRLNQVGLDLKTMHEKGVVTLDRQPLYFDEGIEPKFFTPSGKIELYSTRLAQHEFDPIPRYKPHPTPPKGYYRLLYGRSPVHTFARTTNNPLLTQLQPENVLWINAKEAQLQGITHGEYVFLVNQDGVQSQPIRAKVTQRIRPDSVYMVHGFGHTDPRLKRGFNKGADDQRLITRYTVDPIMGGTGMRGNFVTVMKGERDDSIRDGN